MLSILVLLLVGAITFGGVIVAQRQLKSLQQEVDAFVGGIEERTSPDGNDGQSTDGQNARRRNPLDELLDEALQTEQHGLAVLAVNELTGRAGLAKTKAFSLARGLSRIGLLTGAGGAFALAALGQFERQSLIYAGGSVAMGVICSFASNAVSARCRRLAKRYAELTDVLARQVERHFNDDEEDSPTDAREQIDWGTSNV